jgi:hypothetical protein
LLHFKQRPLALAFFFAMISSYGLRFRLAVVLGLAAGFAFFGLALRFGFVVPSVGFSGGRKRAQRQGFPSR